MVEPIPFKPRAPKPDEDDYPVVIKIIDGKPVEYVCLDIMTEAQFKRYCEHTGTEWFARSVIKVET